MSILLFIIVFISDLFAIYYLTQCNVKTTVLGGICILIVMFISVNLSFLALKPKKISRLKKSEKQIVERALSDIKAASRYCKCKLPDASVYYNESQIVNAFACGFGKIVITRGMIEKLKDSSSEKMMSAVIAHEMGHLVNHHILFTSIIVTNILIVSSVITILAQGVIFLIVLVTSLLASIVLSEFTQSITNVFFRIINLIIWVIKEIIIAFVFALAFVFFRKQEFQADAFAALLGKSFELQTFLSQMDENHMNFIERIVSTHPSNKKRIERLRNIDLEKRIEI